ncbi:MAG: hypothetical protein QF570_05110 [Myxococcota bacterium]|nr:hypothetical protein [Myxococcota bacterium]
MTKPEAHNDDDANAGVAERHTAQGRQHIRFGCYALLVFIVLGFALEMFHALRFGFYLSDETEPRRLMWTLAHAHGALVALIHIAFGAIWPQLEPAARLETASLCLRGAMVALPGGFFLGGLWVIPPDPGLGIVLVPIGGLLLVAAVAFVARQT